MDTNSSSGVYPRIINHIAFSVSDLDQTMEWYKEVLGFTVVKEPVEFVADDSLRGKAAKDMHGPSLKKMRTALLSSANQVGFEIFEYVDPKAERRMDNFEYWKSGFFHICIIDFNIEQLCKKFLKQVENNEVKFGKLFQTKDIKWLSVKIHLATLFKLSPMKI